MEFKRNMSQVQRNRNRHITKQKKEYVAGRSPSAALRASASGLGLGLGHLGAVCRSIFIPGRRLVIEYVLSL
jgi:hypothetical protein